MIFLSFSDNLLQVAYIVFQNGVDNLRLLANHAQFWLEYSPPLSLNKERQRYIRSFGLKKILYHNYVSCIKSIHCFLSRWKWNVIFFCISILHHFDTNIKFTNKSCLCFFPIVWNLSEMPDCRYIFSQHARGIQSIQIGCQLKSTINTYALKFTPLIQSL